MKRLIVGVSGGSDSIALLHYLYQKNEYSLVCVHVNYHKRSTSMRDQVTVENICKENDIPCIVIDYDDFGHGNFQQDARIFRYSAMAQIGHQFTADTLVTGHHFDDAIETYKMQKDSNKSVDMYGIAEHGEMYGFKLWRPMITWRKREIRNYCDINKLQYHDDETNSHTDYTRNAVRHALSTMNATEVDIVAQDMMRAQARNHETNHKIMLELANLHNPMSLDDYMRIDDLLRRKILRKWLLKNGIQSSAMSSSYIEQIDLGLCSGKYYIDLGLKKLSSSYGEICVFENLEYAYTLSKGESITSRFFELRNHGSTIEGLTLSDSDYPIVIRNAHLSDTISMRFGTKKVNRFFIDRKIPHVSRQTWPVIENARKDIVYITGMGCDICHFSNIPNIFMVKL